MDGHVYVCVCVWSLAVCLLFLLDLLFEYVVFGTGWWLLHTALADLTAIVNCECHTYIRSDMYR